MTNMNPQTTADFWDAYITAAEAASSVQTALRAARAAVRCAPLPQEDRRAEDADPKAGHRDGTPLL
jgi:hypothetical protein